MMNIVGAGGIAFEGIRRLVRCGEVEDLGVGLVVVAGSMVINLFVSSYLFRQARQHESPALEGDAAHLRTDAVTSAGVLVGLILIQITGEDWIAAAVALIVGGAILVTGIRLLIRSSGVLVDESL